MQNTEICFCKMSTLSVCTAGSQERQRQCGFYEKSSYANKCMYFVFDEYCDCLKAQMNTQEAVASQA